MLKVDAHAVLVFQYRLAVLVGQPEDRGTGESGCHACPQTSEVADLAGVFHEVIPNTRCL